MIIDTDPGVDDALAIFMAFNSPEVRETYDRRCCTPCALAGYKSSRVYWSRQTLVHDGNITLRSTEHTPCACVARCRSRCLA
jgi:hypothetical protein